MGYLSEYSPEHPRRNKWGYVMQHRLVAEHVLGRFLIRSEVVHHEDRCKQNNAQGNLIVFPDQSAHLTHHKRQESYRHNQGFLAHLKDLASNRLVTMENAADQLGVCFGTVHSACSFHKIPWNGRNSTPSEQSVREALSGRTTEEAADFLGVHHQTLRNHYDILLTKRVSPGSLDGHKEEIRSLATRIRSAELAERYQVNPETVKQSIRRWARQEPDAWSDVVAFQRSRLGIRWSSRRMALPRP